MRDEERMARFAPPLLSQGAEILQENVPLLSEEGWHVSVGVVWVESRITNHDSPVER